MEVEIGYVREGIVGWRVVTGVKKYPNSVCNKINYFFLIGFDFVEEQQIYLTKNPEVIK